jgi:2-hydroxychromene-2-carboxylate isomerase
VPSEVEFHFDIVSPASYLAWTQMPKLAAQTGAKIIYRPFFLPGLFKLAGSASPISVPAKGKWLFADLKRHARRFGVPFQMNRKFPLNSLYVMRGLIAWQEKPELIALGNGFFQAMWADDEDINDPETMARIVSEAGVDPVLWQNALQDEAVKQQVFDINEALAKRGAFGAPTFFTRNGDREEMYWGQDRLDFVREALLG